MTPILNMNIQDTVLSVDTLLCILAIAPTGVMMVTWMSMMMTLSTFRLDKNLASVQNVTEPELKDGALHVVKTYQMLRLNGMNTLELEMHKLSREWMPMHKCIF